MAEAGRAWVEAVLAEVGDQVELNVAVFIDVVVKINEIR